jgi:hypothetical protein
MEDLIQSIYFALPSVLNVEFADPPFIERVDGQDKAGSVGICRLENDLRITSQDEQRL